METETNSNKKKSRTLLILSGVLLSSFLIYFAVMSALGPSHKLDEIKEKYAKSNENEKQDERIYSDSAYLRLLKDKAFLQSKIAMAETDSIYMTINLGDSTANLEISGVTVHSAQISDIRISRILSAGNEYVISSMLATPFTIENDLASIKKEPLMIKMAPKDTSEYKPDVIPDTSDYEPVNYVLYLNNGIRLYVYQSDEDKANDRKHRFIFDLKDRLRNTTASLESIIRFRVPEYHPFIKIELPKAEAKVLYRAIPRHGQIAFYR